MKKTTMIFLSSAIMLAACSATDVEEKSKEILSKSLMSEEVLKNEMTAKNEDLEEGILDSLGIENKETTVEDSSEYEKLQSKITELKEKTKLTVKDVSFENNKTKANAVVDIEFYDVGTIVAESIKTSLESNLVKMYSGETLSEIGVYSSTVDLALDKINSEKLKKKTIENIKVELVKRNDSWEIKKMNEPLMQALTLNFSEAQKGLKDKTKEIKENRLFLEVESNLRSIHSEVSNSIKSGLIKSEDLKKNEELSKKLSTITKETITFSGEKKGDYHISYDKDKKELVVEYNKEKETMKLSLPAQ